MRTLNVLAAVVLLLALLGWITFSSAPSRSSINLETKQIKEDTRDTMESGAESLDDARNRRRGARASRLVRREPG